MRPVNNQQQNQVVEALTDLGCSDAHWSGDGAEGEAPNRPGKAYIDVYQRQAGHVEFGFGFWPLGEREERKAPLVLVPMAELDARLDIAKKELRGMFDSE